MQLWNKSSRVNRNIILRLRFVHCAGAVGLQPPMIAINFFVFHPIPTLKRVATTFQHCRACRPATNSRRRADRLVDTHPWGKHFRTSLSAQPHQRLPDKLQPTQ